MHGIIHGELKKYVIDRLGVEAWNALLDKAGLVGKIHDPGKAYPDEDALALVGAAVEATGKDANEILQDFGRFLGPHLLDAYRVHVNPKWRTLDLLEHTESSMHRVVRTASPDAAPPMLDVTRVSRTKAILHYGSPRKMCAVAKGIIQGAADHFGESVQIEESRCMHRGDARCEIEFTVD